MTDETYEPVTRTIAVAGFPYKSKQVISGVERWVHRFALRGETIQLDDPADLARGENNDHFVNDGEAAPDLTPEFKDLELGLLDDDQLQAIWAHKPPKVDDVKDAVGDDADLASRVLQVENAISSPRTSLVASLEKIVADGGQS